MKNKHSSPEWQAREDWRKEGVFRTGQFAGTDAKRYRQEADRINREWNAPHAGGPSHVGTY